MTNQNTYIYVQNTMLGTCQAKWRSVWRYVWSNATS